jgi:release factor glutamine methyltransferase
MTILELLEWGNNKLKQEQIGSSMLDAEILLAHILKLPRSKLFTGLSDIIDTKRADQYRALIKRRAMHEPVATIIGYKPFYGRDFIVNRFVLTPRPDTEVLIEKAIDISKNLEEETWFADIGTGSGAITVTLAAETKMPVIASDISQEALTTAKQNADKHNVTDLIDFKHGATLDPFVKIFRAMKKAGQPLPENLIICANLPYLSTKQWEQTDPEVQDWEPKEALEAGTDGLDAYWVLFRQLSQHLQVMPENISVLIEIDPSQSEAVKALILHHFSSAKIEIKKDLSGNDRVVIVQLR